MTSVAIIACVCLPRKQVHYRIYKYVIKIYINFKLSNITQLKQSFVSYINETLWTQTFSTFLCFCTRIPSVSAPVLNVEGHSSNVQLQTGIGIAQRCQLPFLVGTPLLPPNTHHYRSIRGINGSFRCYHYLRNLNLAVVSMYNCICMYKLMNVRSIK